MSGGRHGFATWCRRLAPAVATLWLLASSGILLDPCCDAFAGTGHSHGSHGEPTAAADHHHGREAPPEHRSCAPQAVQALATVPARDLSLPEPPEPALAPPPDPGLPAATPAVWRWRLPPATASPARTLLLTGRLRI